MIYNADTQNRYEKHRCVQMQPEYQKRQFILPLLLYVYVCARTGPYCQWWEYVSAMGTQPDQLPSSSSGDGDAHTMVTTMMMMMMMMMMMTMMTHSFRSIRPHTRTSRLSVYCQHTLSSRSIFHATHLICCRMHCVLTAGCLSIHSYLL
eukprot:COSAG06_NODE_11765_length_1467_cov_17.210526_2_plen_149_part_00